MEIEGILKRKVSIFKGFKDKWFIVKKDGILKQFETKPTAGQSPGWKMNIILADVTLNKDGLKFIVTSTEGQKIKLKALNKEDRQKWISAFHSIDQKHFPFSFPSKEEEETPQAKPEKAPKSRISFGENVVFPGNKETFKQEDVFVGGSDQPESNAQSETLEDIRNKFKEMTIVSKRKHHLLVAAIDFGSAYSGCAFSFKTDFIKNPLNVHMMRLGKAGLESQKVPTVLLLKPNKDFAAFGSEAEEQYTSLLQNDPDEAQNWYYFSKFKMQLYENKDLSKSMMLKDVTGEKEMKAVDVFAYCIEHIKDIMFKRAKDQVVELQEEDVHWVVTVPAIWDEAARQFMIDAADKAGIDQDRLTLALEPEAAALCCKSLELQKGQTGGPASLKSFDIGARFLVVDLGGGTVDITSNEVLASGQLKEIHSASGGPWGGNSINVAIWKFFKKVFGKSAVENFMKEDIDDYLDFSRIIEIKKRIISGDTIVFEIPSTLLMATKKVYPDGLSPECSNGIQLVKNKLKVQSCIIKKIFEEGIQTVKSYVADLLQKPELAGVSTILLVGGYASCDLLKESMKEAFSRMTVICPLEPDVIVLKGAVMMGHMDTPIVGRISKVHYGIAIVAGAHKFNSFDRSFKPLTSGEEEFYTIIRKGEPIKVNEVVSEYDFPIQFDTTEAVINIYTSDAVTPPTRITKDNCRKIGNIRIKLPRYRRATQLKIGISNNETEFKVVARDEHTGKCFAGVCRFLN